MPFDKQYDFENFNSFKILLYSIFSRELLELEILHLAKRNVLVRNFNKGEYRVYSEPWIP